MTTEQQQHQHVVDRDWVIKLLQKYESKMDTENDLLTEPKLQLQKTFQNKALVVAPMVDASDLPFRLQCRRYGCNLAYTPMIHAKLYCTSPKYRSKFFDSTKGTLAHDRPLVAQFCGSHLDYVKQAVLEIEPHVDAIDINCGCPQGIARRGMYGAFLLEQEDLLLNLVKELVQVLTKPLCVKVRLLPSGVQDSLKLYEKLVNAGVSLITIHGRNRLQKQHLTGAADWDAIRQAVDLLGNRIPIFANGSVSNFQEAQACLEVTQADGIMASEALLEYPPMFLPVSSNNKRIISRLALAREYLELAIKHPPDVGGQGSGMKCIRGHLHRYLHADMQSNTKIRDLMVHCNSIDEFRYALNYLERVHEETNHDVESEQLSWYVRHRHEEEKKEAEPIDDVNEKKKCTQEEEEEEDLMCGMPDLFGKVDDEW